VVVEAGLETARTCCGVALGCFAHTCAHVVCWRSSLLPCGSQVTAAVPDGLLLERGSTHAFGRESIAFGPEVF
jgi:hypothetical protein